MNTDVAIESNTDVKFILNKTKDVEMTHASYICPHYMMRLHVQSSFTFPKSPLYLHESHKLPKSAMYSYTADYSMIDCYISTI